MAMAESSHSSAYQPQEDDSAEIKEAAILEENMNVTSVDVTGKLVNGTACSFNMDLNRTKGLTVNGEEGMLGYCQLVKVPEKQEKGVKISFRSGNTKCNRTFVIFFESVNDTLKVLNICQHALHKAGVDRSYLCPLWEGVLNIEVESLHAEPGTDVNSVPYMYYVVLDEEVLLLYENVNSERHQYHLQFCKEPTENSLEKAIIQHQTDTLVLESLKWKFCITQASQHEDFTAAVRRVRPKPASAFESLEALGNYLKCTHERNVSVPHFLSRRSIDSGTRSGFSLHIPYEDERNVSVPYAHSSSRRSIDSGTRSGFSLHNAYEDTEDVQGKHAAVIAAEFDRAVVNFSRNEEISLPWIVAEQEIREMIANPVGLGESENDMLSGGLDPNDSNHLMRSFNEIQEQIRHQRYDLALSRLIGTKTIFHESTVQEIRALINQDEVELMMKLYYHSFT